MKRVLLSLMVSLLVFVFAQPAFAHSMNIIQVDEGMVEVKYADGSFSARTKVTVYDKDGNELQSGKLDENARFAFNADNAYRIVGEDGIGHRAEWIVGEATSETTHTNRWIIIAAVVAGFALIAIVPMIRKKKREIVF